MFDGDKPFKVNKPLRLITLFSGYDSQALALKYLGVPFEHYRTCEWAIPSIQALKDLHFEDDDTDYSVGMSKTELVETLYTAGVSADYNVPLTKAQLQRYGEGKLRTIYNNIRACHNLVSICNSKGDDLGIKETDKYCYLLTYLLTVSLVRTYLPLGWAKVWNAGAVLEAVCFGKSNGF